MKRIFALLLTLAIAFSMFGTTAYAAVERARSVTITGTRSVRVDNDIYLDFKISPDSVPYDRVAWYTDDPHLIDLDDDGMVTGLEPGKATVRVRLYATEVNEQTNKEWSVIIGSAEAVITVTGRSSSGEYVRASSEENSTTTSTTRSSAAADSSANSGTVPSSAVKSAVSDAANGGSATLKGYESVSADTLRAAATTMGNKAVSLNFDTMNESGKGVVGRLTINPKDAAKLEDGIDLGIFVNNSQTESVENLFARYFKNEVVVIKAAQSGSYGMTVKIAVPLGDGITKTNNLRVYRYNADKNSFSEIENTGIYVDDNGYVRFSTTEGGYLIVSSGALTKA